MSKRIHRPLANRSVKIVSCHALRMSTGVKTRTLVLKTGPGRADSVRVSRIVKRFVRLPTKYPMSIKPHYRDLLPERS